MSEPALQFRLRDVDDSYPGLPFSLALLSNHGGTLQCLGTGFLIAPGLAITAAHVVRAWMDFGRTDRYERADARFSVVAYQLYDGKYLDWLVEKGDALADADLAILQLARPPWWGEEPDQVRTPSARMNMNPPAVGSEVRVFGFPESRVENNVLYVSPSESRARVREVHMKSDIRIHPTSYVELDGETRGGMSGGPCFDSAWNVVGMCSRGWSFLEDAADLTPVSYMALLWPVMSLPIDPYKTGAFPAWDLFKEGPARVLGHRRVHVTSDGQSRIATVDPDALEAMNWSIPLPHLEASLNFHGENALSYLIEIQSLCGETAAEGLDSNRLHTRLNHYFWELEATLRLSLRIAVVKAGGTLPLSAEWQQFVSFWEERGTTPELRDRIADLGFRWNGITLFEIRSYAAQAREGSLVVTTLMNEDGGRLLACMLEQARVQGGQVNMPGGLRTYYDAALRFSHRARRLKQ